MTVRHAFIRSTIAASLLLAVAAHAGERKPPVKSDSGAAHDTAYRTESAPTVLEPASIGLLLAGLSVLVVAGRSRGLRS